MAKRVKNKQLQLREWENDYFFILNNHGQPQCLICSKILSRAEMFHIKRHYNLCHKIKYENYNNEEKSKLIQELKLKHATSQKHVDIDKNINLSKQSLTASYAIALLVAREKKSFSTGNIIKKGAIEMAKAFNLHETVQYFNTVSLSPQTVSRRIHDIGNYLEEKLKNLLTTCKYYSLCLDESTDNSDVSQLSIFVRIIQHDFSIHEDLLTLVPLHDTTKGIDIYNALKEQVKKFVGSFDKCSAIVTDGAPAMTGSKTGLKGLLFENNVKCLMFHCIIHQEVLCGKALKLSDTMKTVTKITNIIRGGNRSLSHRKFQIFLDEVNASYPDLLMHSEIRWLSAGKCLQRFFALRKEIPDFLERHVLKDSLELQNKFKSTDFLKKLAFLTDMTNHLNILNLQLQKRNQTISDLISNINGFRSKINLFLIEISKNELHHFPCCEEIIKDLDELEEVDEKSDFSIVLETLKCVADEFEIRFKDFDVIKEELRIFNNPMKIKIQDQQIKYRQELCDLQADEFMISRTEVGLEFFKILSKDKYPNLKDLGLRICSMFGSTYNCESAFSIMKHIKSLRRTLLTDSSLIHSMRIAVTPMDIDISALVGNAEHSQVSH